MEGLSIERRGFFDRLDASDFDLTISFCGFFDNLLEFFDAIGLVSAGGLMDSFSVHCDGHIQSDEVGAQVIGDCDGFSAVSVNDGDGRGIVFGWVYGFQLLGNVHCGSVV